MEYDEGKQEDSVVCVLGFQVCKWQKMHSGVFGIKRIPVRQFPSAQEVSRDRTSFTFTKLIQEHFIHFHELDLFVVITSKKAEGEYLLPDGLQAREIWWKSQ